MGELILKKEILEKIKKDPVLFGKVAECLDTTVRYGLILVHNNDVKLTQANVLRILKNYLGVTKDSDLLEEREIEPKKSVAV